MIVSTAAATQTLVAALSLQQASYKPPPNVSTPDLKTADATSVEFGYNTPSHPTVFVAGGDSVIQTQGASCKVEKYDAPDVEVPKFAPYDEKTANIYRYRKQLSVNLGSWYVLLHTTFYFAAGSPPFRFVQENWMNPSLFSCATGPKASELDVAAGWDNPKSSRSVLEKHWDTWITEDDFAWLQKTGINTVRIPIGYWTLGSQYCQGTAFEQVASVYEHSWPRLLRAIDWAAKYKIGVLVDLHGAVGSQNGRFFIRLLQRRLCSPCIVGQSHSGTSDGKVKLFDDEDNITKTIDVLKYLTKQLVPISNVVGIQILNEPNNVVSLPEFCGYLVIPFGYAVC
jgi:glucan 1,3-beta-glucosidase